MIKHIVMFKLQEDIVDKAEKITTAKDMTKDFETIIPTLKSFKLVTNSEKAPVSNYDIALICDFEDIDGLNEYQTNPKHLEFGKFISGIKESRACIDYEY